MCYLFGKRPLSVTVRAARRQKGRGEMESKMLEALRRYIQDYGWNWGIVHSLINRKFGTDYTLEELQHFYIRRAWPQPGKARTVFK